MRSLVVALCLLVSPTLAFGQPGSPVPPTFHLDVDPITAPLYSGHVVVTGAVYDTARPWDGVGGIVVQFRPTWIDGTPLAAWSFPTGLRMGQARPEVAATYGTAALTDVGFSQDLPTLAPGFYEVLLTAITANGVPVPSPVLRVSVNSSLRSWIDQPFAGASVAPGPVLLSGWALDASYFLGGSGIEKITVCAKRVDLTSHGCQPVAEAQLGGARPDVAAAFGVYYSGAGWFAITTPLSQGTWDLIVTASTLSGINSLSRVMRVIVK